MDKQEKPKTGQNDAGWTFDPGAGQPPLAASEVDSVEWTASEYIHHQKGFEWYAALVLGAIVLAALAYLFTKDVVATVAIIVAAVLFAVAAKSKPRVLTYRLDASGLNVGNRSYSYDNFKAFSLVQDDAFTNIVFVPLKRFGMPLTIYFAPEDQEKILAVISQHLPLQQGGSGLLDRLMHRIRF